MLAGNPPKRAMTRLNVDEFHDTDNGEEGSETEASDCGCGGDWYKIREI